LNENDLIATQSAISAPKIQRNLDKLAMGSGAPPIQVANGLIIEGHHRYIAGKLFGWQPDIVPGVAINAIRKVLWQEVFVDTGDWDGPANRHLKCAKLYS
jgi:hypothetical protein